MIASTPAADRLVEVSDNLPPPLITVDALAMDHSQLGRQVADIETLLASLPARIDDDDTNGSWQDRILDVAKIAKGIEATRVAAKAPYLKAGDVVDSYFKTLQARAVAVHKAISAVVEGYLQRKAAEERARREAAARRLREEEERQRQEAARRAEEARKAEEANRLKTAERHEIKAAEAEMAARTTAATAVAMEQSAQAKSADLARTRSATGSLGTLQDKWDFRLDDIDALKGAPLWPYIDRAAKEKAIRKYMDANAPKSLPEGVDWQPLAGVTFFRTSKLRVK
jgi:hypothetical protein